MFFVKRIWQGDDSATDTYVDFYGKFKRTGDKKLKLNIVCDGSFSVELNGKMCAFGSCADYPEYKEYYSFDISKYALEDNDIKFTVWHQGFDSSCGIKAQAFLAFEIYDGDRLVLTSGKEIKSASNPYYKSGLKKIITTQMGLSYLYDGSSEKEQELQDSVEYGLVKAEKRRAKNLKLLARGKSVITKLENSILIDMQFEKVGFLDLEFISKKKQNLKIAFGEHLVEGHVPYIIGHRDFTVEYVAKEGENKFMGVFRRLAGRYLEIFADDISALKIKYAGLRETVYPLIKKEFKAKGELEQKIYDTAVRTMECCMHEHYEDCPWREQALYALDSRNEMLCGYYAFDNIEFIKENLELLARSRRKDGLLAIAGPSTLSLSIPFFSLIYPIQVYEYVKHTGDEKFLQEIGFTVKKIINTFASNVEENGLIADFPYPYWNFYEWTEDSNNVEEISRTEDAEYRRHYSLILNCAYILAVEAYEKLTGTVIDVSKTKQAIKDVFYVKEKGVYRLYSNKGKCSELGNAMAILVGVAGKEIADKLKKENDLIPVSLSMLTFYYDALLKVDKKNADFVLKDINRRYKKMLDQGTTTFWETEKGAEDFGGAGSLCHGWSAIPVYYMNVLKD